MNLLLTVAEYYCTKAFDVYKLSLVCLTWRKYMECENAQYFWSHFDKTSGARSFTEYKECLIRDLQELKKKKSVEF